MYTIGTYINIQMYTLVHFWYMYIQMYTLVPHTDRCIQSVHTYVCSADLVNIQSDVQTWYIYNLMKMCAHTVHI